MTGRTLPKRALPRRAVGEGLRRELSVRTDSVGGDVKENVEESGPPPAVQGRSQITILIHGFNNTQQVARQHYENLFKNLEELVPGISVDPDGRFRGFHWPGDSNLGPISFISYPVEIGDAVRSAESLTHFVRQLYGPGNGIIQVDVVAHSLGCRLILEAMNALAVGKESHRAVFRNVCLMAAAVPLYMVGEDAGRYLRNGAELSKRLLVLYSYHDAVLCFAFPLGQTLGGEGFFPSALGRYGPPPGLPLPGGRLVAIGHTQYWKNKSVSTEVAIFLGLIQLRETPARSTPEREVGISAEEGDADD